MSKAVTLFIALVTGMVAVNLIIKNSLISFDSEDVKSLFDSDILVFHNKLKFASLVNNNELPFYNFTLTDADEDLNTTSTYSTLSSSMNVEPFDENLPLVLEWNLFYGKSLFDDRISLGKQCRFRCTYSKNKKLLQNAAVIIYHMGGGHRRFSRSTNLSSVNVFLNFEPPPHRPYYQMLKPRFFDATITYRQDSTIPVYYDSFVPLDGPNDTDRWTEAEVNAAVKAKEKPALWMVSHCKTPSAREDYVEALQKYIDVTQIGKCNQVECPRFQDCEKSFIKNHYFYIAFENSVCIDYITEKFFRIRQLIVPIVLDRRVFRGVHERLLNYTIIASDFDSPKQLAEYLQYLVDRPDEYRKYFEWTKFYKKSEQPFLNTVTGCKVCEIANQVHAGTYTKKRLHIHEWWGKNRCYGPVGNDLVVQSNITENFNG